MSDPLEALGEAEAEIRRLKAEVGYLNACHNKAIGSLHTARAEIAAERDEVEEWKEVARFWRNECDRLRAAAGLSDPTFNYGGDL